MYWSSFLKKILNFWYSCKQELLSSVWTRKKTNLWKMLFWWLVLTITAPTDSLAPLTRNKGLARNYLHRVLKSSSVECSKPQGLDIKSFQKTCWKFMAHLTAGKVKDLFGVIVLTSIMCNILLISDIWIVLPTSMFT